MSDWHPEDVKAAIRKAGGTLSAIAVSEGVSLQAISAAVSGRASARLEKAIAEFLQLAPHEIWPSRYGRNNQRIRLRAQSEAERAAA